MAKRGPTDVPTKKDHAKEVQKILRRYLVQVDSEANVVPELNDYLKKSIDVYLGIYPNDDLRRKLQQGWLKAETDPSAKISRLGKWIKEDISLGLKESDIRKLRQTRLSYAQTLKNQSETTEARKSELTSVVLEEALAIAEILEGKPEADEFNYVAAREYYGLKSYDKALPLFKELIKKAVAYPELGKWGLQSQNLVLDIYNAQDNFDGIIEQVAFWKDSTKDNKNIEVLKENKAMSKLNIDARFARAANMKESREALDVFYNFCFEGVYPKKSCSNAKVLSLKFADQAKLISLLEKANDEKALVTEYELMGRYSDAAALQEKLKLSPQGLKAPYELFLKISLLYELDGNFKKRDQILTRMMKKMKREKSLSAKWEGALFLTLEEAGLINKRALFLPWSLKRKLSLARRFELEAPSKDTKKMILGQKESQGPIWSKLVLKKFTEPFKKANKIKFYGRYSKYLFKKRTKAIDSFVNLSKKYLDGADLETRAYILHMLTRVYSKMTEDILATPLPKDLDAETMAQVQGQLQGMSAPFEKVRSDYQRLLGAQLKEMKPEKLKTVQVNLDANPANYSDLIKLGEAPESRVVALSAVEEGMTLKENLLKTPTNKEILRSLKELYKTKKLDRLAAYYAGRLESLNN